jgi:hypothetical protein
MKFVMVDRPTVAFRAPKIGKNTCEVPIQTLSVGLDAS